VEEEKRCNLTMLCWLHRKKEEALISSLAITERKTK
jgi:hypothetical protein